MILDTSCNWLAASGASGAAAAAALSGAPSGDGGAVIAAGGMPHRNHCMKVADFG